MTTKHHDQNHDSIEQYSIWSTLRVMNLRAQTVHCNLGSQYLLLLQKRNIGLLIRALLSPLPVVMNIH